MTAMASTQSQPHLHRALDLAEAANLIGTAHLVLESMQGETYQVPSRDRSTVHDVFVDCAGIAHCDCLAGQFSRACAHAGAVEYYRQLRAMALARVNERDEAIANWLAGFAW